MEQRYYFEQQIMKGHLIKKPLGRFSEAGKPGHFWFPDKDIFVLFTNTKLYKQKHS